MREKIRSLEPEKAENNEEICLVCMVNKRNIMFEECGHLALCPKCATKRTFSNCIICR